MNKMISDRYMIVTSLGEGGMADVYLAIDTILNREVAIKILRGELCSDPVTLLRFQREANAASKLNHPNVVDVYDVGENDGRHYIVMEYVRGRTLKQLISQRGALHKEEAVDIMIQLTSAVEHAHENNIIHRDIKPQNVLVKDDGTIKITDFGIALAHDAVQLTQSDAVLGSAHYLAPETTRGEPATNQIDVYALGIVFYELLSGTVPFKGDNPVQIAMKHLREEVPSVREFNPTLPQSIENIIIKATVKNRKLRYISAKDMRKDIEKCLLPEYANVEALHLEDTQMDPTRVMDDVMPTHADVKKATTSQLRNNEKVEKKKNRSKTMIGVLLAAIAILASAVILYFSGIISGFSFDPMITVPDIREMEKEEARSKLLDAGYDEGDIRFIEATSDEAKAGEVFESEPAIGKKVKKSEGIKVSISNGNYFVLENYEGEKYSEIEPLINEALPKASLKVEYVVAKTVSDVGKVISFSGAKVGDKMDPNTVSTLYFKVYSAPEVVVSGIIGMNVDAAKAKLQEQGAIVIKIEKLTNGLSEEELASIQKDVVVEVDPPENTKYVQTGESTITLYYYK